MRLDRLVSHATGLSRSQANRAIRAGHVRVGGTVVTDPGAAVAADGQVEFRGMPLAVPTARYYMLNKPPGYVCAARDPRHRTVLELLDVPHKERLHVAGRLDIDATGLVLLTDDGEWSHRLTSPRHHHPKTYEVTLAAPLTAAAQAQLQHGVQLRGEPRPCAPAQLVRIDAQRWQITLTQGMYHQVKRMFAAVGNRVLTLERRQIGALALDPALARGAARPLTAAEVAAALAPAPPR